MAELMKIMSYKVVTFFSSSARIYPALGNHLQKFAGIFESEE